MINSHLNFEYTLTYAKLESSSYTVYSLLESLQMTKTKSKQGKFIVEYCGL